VRASRIVEKPPRDQVPSNLAAVAGYVLTPDVFGYLEQTSAGQGGEIWLADGVQKIAAQGKLYALEFHGRRYDAGNKLEFLQATVDLALERPDLGPAFRQYLEAKLKHGRSTPPAPLAVSQGEGEQILTSYRELS
jgi:UTP--glucose-1-phosphate uridylyltransferase